MGRRSSHKWFSCPDGMSYCSKCDSYKPADEFSPNKEAPRGRHYWCRKCINENDKKKYSHARRLKHKEKYGISQAEYLAMYNAQNGVCIICGRPETKKSKGTVPLLSVDHNHQTGAVRGLLCSSCNAGLGAFRDDMELLEKALDYLRSRDGERTTNPRPPICSNALQEMSTTVNELDRSVKGLPKRLVGNHLDAKDLPLFSIS